MLPKVFSLVYTILYIFRNRVIFFLVCCLFCCIPAPSNIQLLSHNLMLKQILVSVGANVRLQMLDVTNIAYIINISITSTYNIIHSFTWHVVPEKEGKKTWSYKKKTLYLLL